MGQHVIQKAFYDLAGGFDHVLQHFGIVVHRVAQALKGEHVPDAADHGAAVHAQGKIPVFRVQLFKPLYVGQAPLVIHLKALFLHPFPVLRRFYGGMDKVRDGVVPVAGHLGGQAVPVDDDVRLGPLLDDLLLKGRVQEKLAAHVAQGIEGEQHIRLPV